jgi:hypothetical protein
MADQKDTKKTEQAGVQTQAQRGTVKVTMHIGKEK